jgi:multicomponent Na+:H+ antiporter subunit E
VRTLALTATLFAFYCALSGQFHNVFLMQVGLVACFGIALLAHHMGTDDDEGFPIRYWVRTAGYIPWLLWQIILANIDVAKRVWSPTLRINPQMIKVKHDLATPYGLATFANSITLTPGTVTVAVEDGELEIHALSDEAAQDLLGGEMHRRVKQVEGRIQADDKERA